MKSFICLFALASPVFAATSYILPGNSETGYWDLNYTNYNSGSSPAYPASGSTATAWGGPIAASATSATFTKLSGNGYFIGSGSGIYGTTGTNIYAVGDLAPMAGLANLIFQARTNNPDVMMGATGGGFSLVELYINGGSTAIAATYTSSTEISSGISDFAWQWDLSSYGSILSYQIQITTNAHNLVYGDASGLTTISASDSFAQAVPEPSTSLLGIAALGLTLLRRRRA